MKVQTTQFGEVNVRFHHDRYDDFNYRSVVSGKKKAVLDTSTECIISVGPKPRDLDNDTRPTVFGTTYLNPADTFDKETGRVLSLHRALDVMQENLGATNKTVREILAGYYSR